MPKRAAAKLNVRVAFDSMPTEQQQQNILQAIQQNGGTLKAADLIYTTPSKVSLKN